MRRFITVRSASIDANFNHRFVFCTWHRANSLHPSSISWLYNTIEIYIYYHLRGIFPFIYFQFSFKLKQILLLANTNDNDCWWEWAEFMILHERKYDAHQYNNDNKTFNFSINSRKNALAQNRKIAKSYFIRWCRYWRSRRKKRWWKEYIIFIFYVYWTILCVWSWAMPNGSRNSNWSIDRSRRRLWPRALGYSALWVLLNRNCIAVWTLRRARACARWIASVRPFAHRINKYL